MRRSGRCWEGGGRARESFYRRSPSSYAYDGWFTYDTLSVTWSWSSLIFSSFHAHWFMPALPILVLVPVSSVARSSEANDDGGISFAFLSTHVPHRPRLSLEHPSLLPSIYIYIYIYRERDVYIYIYIYTYTYVYIDLVSEKRPVPEADAPGRAALAGGGNNNNNNNNKLIVLIIHVIVIII